MLLREFHVWWLLCELLLVMIRTFLLLLLLLLLMQLLWHGWQLEATTRAAAAAGSKQRWQTHATRAASPTWSTRHEVVCEPAVLLLLLLVRLRVLRL